MYRAALFAALVAAVGVAGGALFGNEHCCSPYAPVPTGIAVRSVSINSTGQILAAGCADGSVRLWDIPARRFISLFSAHSGGANSVAFSPTDPCLLATGGSDGLVRLWNICAPNCDSYFESWERTASSGVNSLAFTYDGVDLAAGLGTGTVQFWGVASGDPSFPTITLPQGGTVESVAFAHRANRTFLLVGSSGAPSVTYWRMDGPDAPTQRWSASNAVPPVNGVAISADDGYVAEGDSTGRISIYDRRNLTYLPPPSPPNIAIRNGTTFAHPAKGILPAGCSAVAFHPSVPNVLVSGGRNGEVRRWSFNPPTFFGLTSGWTGNHPQRVNSVVYSPTGSVVASGGQEGSVAVWDAESGALEFRDYCDANGEFMPKPQPHFGH